MSKHKNKPKSGWNGSVLHLLFRLDWSYLNNTSEDVYLYLKYQNTNNVRLEIQLFNGANQMVGKQDVQITRTCERSSIMAKDIATEQLAVTMHLYSAEGNHLFTKQGSREQDNILLDQKGFYIDLELNGSPPNIAKHSL